MMRTEGSPKEYKSPAKKLLAFFEKSRDRWKSRCLEAKYEEKKLKNQVWYLKASKTELKSRIKELEARVCELSTREKALEKELEALKKSPSTTRHLLY